MSARLWVTVISPTTGQPVSGLTGVKLFYGAAPLAYYGYSISAGAEYGGVGAGTLTEDGTTGSYYIDIAYSNQFSIRINGVVQDEYTNIWINADDLCGTFRLGETGAGALPSGASLIGVSDTGNRFSASNVQAVLEELAGSRTSPYTNQNLKWVYDKVDGWNVSDAEINALASAGASNADFVKLHAITSSAAELNKLTGASSNVTAANLNTLTAGSSSNADALHTHTSITPSTLRGVQSGANCSDLTVNLAAYSSGGNGGNLLVDPSGLTTGTWGTIKIKYSDTGLYYPVITSWETGDLDMTGTRFLGQFDSSDPGILRNFFVEIDSRLRQLWGAAFPKTDTNWVIMYQSASVAADGTVAADVTEVIWERTTASFVKVLRVNMPATEHLFSHFKLRFRAAVAGSAGVGKGYLKFERDGATSGTDQAEVTMTADGSTGYAWYSVEITLPQSYSSPQRFNVYIKGDGTNITYVDGSVTIEAH